MKPDKKRNKKRKPPPWIAVVNKDPQFQMTEVYCSKCQNNRASPRPAIQMIMTDVFRSEALRFTGWMTMYTSKSTSESGPAPPLLIAFTNEPINSERRA